MTTSVGRLFDAAAAFVGCCTHASYEGEGPMRLEALCGTPPHDFMAPIALPLGRDADGVWRSDWAPLLPVLQDADRAPSSRAAMFHATLAQALCDQALAVRAQTGVRRVGLGGGVFQNRVLTERAAALLRAADFDVLVPQYLPVNDAAISFGQIIETCAHYGSHTAVQ